MAAAVDVVSEQLKYEAYVASLPKRAVSTPEADGIEAQADALLRTWAAWVRGTVFLGLPKISATETANTGGASRGGVTEMPEDVVRTDRSVAQLGDKHRSILRRTILLRYEKGLPYEVIARELRMPLSQARATLSRAQRAVWRYRETLEIVVGKA